MMFRALLSARWSDFPEIADAPKALAVGLASQFVLLPLVTFPLTIMLSVDASEALGMILVSSCPGGSFSNIMTWLARGNLAISISISMTGASTSASLVFTPLNFAFYAGLKPKTSALFG